MVRSKLHLTGVAAVVLATLQCHAQPAEWVQAPGPGGGDLRALDLDGQIAVASTIAGLHVSTDAGHTWRGAFRSPSNPGATFGFVASVGGVLFAQNEALEYFTSTDSGGTWLPANPPLPGVAVARMEHADGRTYAQLTPTANQPLYYSDDLGQTWAPLAGSPVPADGLNVSGSEVFTSTVELRDFGFTRVVTAYQSTDRGQAFTVIGGSDADVNGIPAALAATPQRVGTKLRCGEFVSDDNGQTWRFFDINESLRTQFCGSDFCQFIQQSAAVIGDALYVHAFVDFMDQDEPPDNFKLWKTTDFLTWSEVPASAALPDLLVSSSFWRGDANSIFIAGSVGLYRSDDGGINWVESNQGINASIVWRMESVSNALIANIVNTNYVARATSPTGEWTRNSIFDNGAFFGTVMALYSPDGNTLLSGHLLDGITRSDDTGLTWDWSRTGVPQYNGTAGQQYSEVEAFTKLGSALFAGTGEGLEHRSDGGQGFVHVGRGILRSADNGLTWAGVNTGLQSIGFNSFFEPQFDPILSMTTANNTVLAGGMFLGVARSTNGGNSWTYSNTGLPMFTPQVAASEITVLTTVASTIYLGMNGVDQGEFPGVGSLFMSTDAGATWTPAYQGLPAGSPVAAIASHDGVLYAGLALRHSTLPPFRFQGLGVYRSTDNGSSWEPAGEALTNVSVRCLEVFNGTLYAGTDHLGVWALINPPACGPGDYNQDGDFGTDQDIEAFFACLAGHCCPTCWQGGSDFNGDGDFGTDQDIEAFFRVLAGGNC
jgi:hypothetical protein